MIPLQQCIVKLGFIMKLQMSWKTDFVQWIVKNSKWKLNRYKVLPCQKFLKLKFYLLTSLLYILIIRLSWPVTQDWLIFCTEIE
jgi:hypothetical protein